MHSLEQLAQLIRYYILVSTTTAGSGHPTSSLSAVELTTTLLFDGFFRSDLDNLANSNNDHLIFSKGHAAPLLYALYVAAGKLSEEEIRKLRSFGSPLEGHPTMNFPYTEAATGSLGQGLSVGVGMSINSKYLDKNNSRTYVLLGDSEMAEGQVWEAIQLAAHYKLNNLVGIIDVNRLGQRGETMYGHDVRSYAYKLRAFGWQTVIVDGHNIHEIADAYREAIENTDMPTMIIAHTIKGKGVSVWENEDGWHGKPLNQEQLKQAIAELGDIDLQVRGEVALPSEIGQKPMALSLQELTLPLFTEEKIATKEAFGRTLVELGKSVQNLVVLDAEMSNSTRTDLFKQAHPDRFFEMFIAEQNMVSAAVGLSKVGKLPVVSTFAAFLTRSHDQLRMARYSEATMIVCGSYGGVSLGMDGVSQMGLEDIAMMRSVAKTVFYPSDAVSMAKVMNESVKQSGITYVRATRESTPVLYSAVDNFVVGGSKVLRHSDDDAVTVVSAGITVHEAIKAHSQLLDKEIHIRVIDLYSIQPLDVETLMAAANQTKAIITVEDHYQAGGIGELVRAALVNQSTPVYSLCVDKQPRSGKPEELLAYEEIDADAIVQKTYQIMSKE